MNTTPTVWTPPPVHFGAKDLANIRELYAREANEAEFQRFITMCQIRGLNPQLGHAYLFLFNTSENSKKPRQAVTVISESGYLTAADRIRDDRGNHIYLPDDETPRYTYDRELKDPNTNPLGIVSATVAVRKFVQGEWHKIPAEVYWDERAPIVEDGAWEENPQTGKNFFKRNGEMILDPKKPGWSKQGRNMLAKCARVAACRYAFPDQMGGLYSEEERHAIEAGVLKVIDMTPDEIIAEHTKVERLKAIGADKAVPIFFGKSVEYIPLGRLYDQCAAHLRQLVGDPEAIARWTDANRIGIKEWLSIGNKGDYLQLRIDYLDPAAKALKEKEAAAKAE